MVVMGVAVEGIAGVQLVAAAVQAGRAAVGSMPLNFAATGAKKPIDAAKVLVAASVAAVEDDNCCLICP